MKPFVKRNLLAAVISSAISFGVVAAAYADAPFVVKKISVVGLNRITLDTVKSYLPVRVGETVDAAKTADIIRTLYKTGFFSNVDLAEQGDTLIIKVTERATIGSINISGNKQITKKQLLDALKTAGFNEGQPYDDAVVHGLKEALMQQYYSLGYHNASVDARVTQLERNRVGVDIKIDEGGVAKVKEIKIFGNNVFSSRQLIRKMSLSTGSLLSFITDSDKYSREKLDADLEALRSFYLDNGYLQFKVEDAKATMTKDKKSVYIHIYITEGPLYKISGWDIQGNLLGKGDEIRKLITIKNGEIFSRKQIIDSTTAIGNYLGNYGYASPSIHGDPSVDEVNKKIFVKFQVDPGKRIYVRRINFSGNTKTHESVLRREMRQQEGSLYSLAQIEESKRRLNNLGYVQNIDAKLEPVPESPDQVDLLYNVKEASSVVASANLGYSDTDGIIYGVNLNDQNFLGTGKGVGIQFSHSKYSYGYGFNYFDPYFTQSNVSLSVDLYNQRTTPDSIKLSAYSTNTYGGTAIFGIPLSEYSRINLGYGFEHISVGVEANSSDQAKKFVADYGDVFNTAKLVAGWTYNNLDRSIFPTEGLVNNLNLELYVPVSTKNKLQYYKASDTIAFYQPLTRNFIVRLGGDIGYGNGYGGMKDLPFFKNYYCGGIGSVRGFEGSSIGPRDNNNNPVGGNVLTDASLGLIFPNPFGETVRSTIFVDTGNVFYRRFNTRDFRTSAGLQVEWRSPMGMVITASLAKPIAKHTDDRTDFFQFNLGASI
ncbi:MAG: outer membrane protein assembly factor BamA [Gammaproteobacteria bacterium GWE2_37_16]|nr:MAG: outer membrane protein assembly factor BamA [Gammaproteobacteria bacterium GWE2_37_16]